MKKDDEISFNYTFDIDNKSVATPQNTNKKVMKNARMMPSVNDLSSISAPQFGKHTSENFTALESDQNLYDFLGNEEDCFYVDMG